ncbi:MAG: hypothetical protein HC916_09830 [Coleofasciculaceae cyanobacterium SM2_1_6]|nr:hypothetical protein [Coleofasciculaceae cyanobacterium SM2_1_6]
MVAVNVDRPVQNNLETLERLLQHTLQMDLLYVVPLQVECFSWEDILVVVVQHIPQIVPNDHQVFHLLEQTIRAAAWSANQQVQIYLRIVEQGEAYADYTFRLPRSVTSLNNQGLPQGEHDLENSDNFSGLDDREAIDELSNLEDLGNLDSGYDSPTDTDSNRPLRPRPLDLDALMRGEPQPQPPEQLQVELIPPPPPDPEVVATERRKKARKKRRAKQMPILMMGLAGVALGAGIVGFTFLGRPCVMGSCEVIPKARQLSIKSQATITPLASAKDVLLAEKELRAAIASLRQIPFWSSHYQQAQTDLRDYVNQAQKLEQLVIALKQGAKAAEMGQKLPLPEPQWQETQQVWREAIAQLEAVPKEDYTYAFAVARLTQYKENLRSVNLRLAEEQQAVKNLRNAKETADIAQVRQGVAQFLTDWREVSNNWRNALARLEEIPNTTTAYAAAQELKQEYTPKFQAAVDRTEKEQIAQKFFDQANDAAKAAQNFGSENQWTLAVTNWQTAIAYIQQVEAGTSAATRTQPLIDSYNNSLKQAQANLQLANVRQRASVDLDRTCKGNPVSNPAICTYDVVDNLIRVRLAAGYTERLRQTAIVATVRGDTKTHTGVIQHINTLQKALQAISQNNRLGLEIYDANGYLISVYTPN